MGTVRLFTVSFSWNCQRPGDRLVILPRRGRQIAGGIIDRDRPQGPVVAAQDRERDPPPAFSQHRIAGEFKAYARDHYPES